MTRVIALAMILSGCAQAQGIVTGTADECRPGGAFPKAAIIYCTTWRE